MLSERELQELLHYQPSKPVLSVYLNTDPSQGNVETHKRHLRAMLKEIEAPDDVNAVLRYFDFEHDWSGRSVAVFSCAADRFLRAFPLAVATRSRVRLADRPYVKPLADLLDSYGGYGVVLVDKQGARLFYFHLGELVETEGFLGQAVRHTKRGGGSQAAGRRGGSPAAGWRGGVAGQTDHAEEVAGRNFREAAEIAARFFSERKVRRVVIGGTEENVAQFRAHLPKAWQSLVIGTVPLQMNASHNEVLERTLAIGEQAEHRREAALVEAIVTGAAKGQGAVMGLEDTLRAVGEGRVQSLVLRDGYRAPGYRCSQCGHLTSLSLEACLFCGGKVEQISDAVEAAVRTVMAGGGDVEVLHTVGEPAFEHIGALLRY